MTVALDTHRMIKRLTQAGFTEPQAETVVDVVRESHGADLSAFATKADLAEGLAGVRAEVAEVRVEVAEVRAEVASQGKELRAEIATLAAQLRGELRTEIGRVEVFLARDKADLLKWVIGLFLVQVGVIAGLLKLLAGH